MDARKSETKLTAEEAGSNTKLRIDRLKKAYRALEHRFAELQGSFYLSGARKKIDITSLPGFGTIAAQVKANWRGGMDYDRLYTLWQAAQRSPDGPSIVEVGAYLGGSATFIAESFRSRGLSPRFYVCDTFAGHPRVDETFDPLHHREGRKFLNTSPELVAGYLAPYKNVQLVVGDIIETAERELGAEPAFAFVHVDVDVYPATDFCLRFFAPRLAPGAWLIVDDYGFVTCPGAKKAVDEFMAGHPQFVMIHLLSGQAVIFRVA